MEEDHVKISEARQRFDKGFKGHRCKEMFQVTTIKDTSPVTYVFGYATNDII